MENNADKLTVKTRDFDEIEVSRSEIITFPNGILAFEEYNEYILIAPLGNDKYPMWLQSVQNANLCFILFNPLEFCADYNVTVDDDEIAPLELEDNKDSQFYVIAVIPENNMEATVNLKSPIILNVKNKKAVQVIAAEDYPIKFPVFAKED